MLRKFLTMTWICCSDSPQQRARWLQQPLHRGREEDEGEGDAQHGEENAEQLPRLSQGSHVTVPWKEEEEEKEISVSIHANDATTY